MRRTIRTISTIGRRPWNHGGWRAARQFAGAIFPVWQRHRFYFRQKMEEPLVGYWLKDKGTLPVKAAEARCKPRKRGARSIRAPREAQTSNIYFMKTKSFPLMPPQGVRQGGEASIVRKRSGGIRSVSPSPDDMTHHADHPAAGTRGSSAEQRSSNQRPDVITCRPTRLANDPSRFAGQVTAKTYRNRIRAATPIGS